MTYRLIIARPAQHQMEKLDSVMRRRVDARIMSLAGKSPSAGR